MINWELSLGMFKWIVPLLLLTGYAGTSIDESLELDGEIIEYVPTPILPKDKRDTANTQQQSICLPPPSDQFLKLKEKAYVGVYEYLILTLDSLDERIIILVDDYCGRTEWEQDFKGGVYY
ncbi:MAG: hypothetical protein P8I55_09385 [Crocinitomix sp.]|nr:hypothetical protein [Crocinitomix sp.]